jgi:hypothetical protein
LDRNIRVRVVSDSFGRGKFYNQKVTILDVVTPDVCTVLFVFWLRP